MPAAKLKRVEKKLRIPQKGKEPEPAYREVVKGLRDQLTGSLQMRCCIQGCCVSWCCVRVVFD